MDVTQELDDLRHRVAGCSLAAFADIGSQMILATSTGSRIPQEDLDSFGVVAQTLLDGALGSDARPIVAEGDAPLSTAWLATAQDVRVFLRSAARPAEVLVLVCGREVDLPKALGEGRTSLEKVAAAKVDAAGGGE